MFMQEEPEKMISEGGNESYFCFWNSLRDLRLFSFLTGLQNGWPVNILRTPAHECCKQAKESPCLRVEIRAHDLYLCQTTYNFISQKKCHLKIFILMIDLLIKWTEMLKYYYKRSSSQHVLSDICNTCVLGVVWEFHSDIGFRESLDGL